MRGCAGGGYIETGRCVYDLLRLWVRLERSRRRRSTIDDRPSATIDDDDESPHRDDESGDVTRARGRATSTAGTRRRRRSRRRAPRRAAAHAHHEHVDRYTYCGEETAVRLWRECKAKAIRRLEGASASELDCGLKIILIILLHSRRKTPIKVFRTDTTLDLSESSRKVIVCAGAVWVFMTRRARTWVYHGYGCVRRWTSWCTFYDITRG